MALIGILGGTFDPIHFGHLRLAQELAQGLRLDGVRFIPSGRPWHRGVPGATAEQRLAMTHLGVAGNPLFSVDEREVRLGAPGYSVETLTELSRELAGTQSLCLLLGADAFLGLPSWHRWRELFGLAHIAVAQRPGFSLLAQQMDAGLRAEIAPRISVEPMDLQQTSAGRVIACNITPLDISATCIRAAIKGGHSPRYLLPDAVLDYIRSQNLYS